jgi:hypothetical protein
MTASQPNLLELAKQGDPQAIAALMNRQLQPKGITAKVSLKDDCLQIILEAKQLPHQSSLITFIRKAVTNLELSTVKTVKVDGQQHNKQVPDWSEEFALEADLASLPQSEKRQSNVNKTKESKGVSEDLNLSLSPINQTTPNIKTAIAVKSMLFFCGVLSTLICMTSGCEMQSIRSESGNSVAEVYYQKMGTFAVGLSFFVGPLLIYFSYSISPVGFKIK